MPVFEFLGVVPTKRPRPPEGRRGQEVGLLRTTPRQAADPVRGTDRTTAGWAARGDGTCARGWPRRRPLGRGGEHGGRAQAYGLLTCTGDGADPGLRQATETAERTDQGRHHGGTPAHPDPSSGSATSSRPRTTARPDPSHPWRPAHRAHPEGPWRPAPPEDRQDPPDQPDPAQSNPHLEDQKDQVPSSPRLAPRPYPGPRSHPSGPGHRMRPATASTSVQAGPDRPSHPAVPSPPRPARQENPKGRRSESRRARGSAPPARPPARSPRA